MYSTDKQCTNVLYAVRREEMPVIMPGENARKKRSYSSQLGDKIPARLVLYFLSWSGFMVSFMMRNDINFALVAMTRTVEEHANFTFAPNVTSSSTTNITTNITTTTSMPAFTLSMDESDMHRYAWSPTVKSVIVSSFYWCYVLSQVAGGVATEMFGTKSVFGWSQLATALCSLLIPLAAEVHYSAVITLRSIQGFASGLTWPAMYAIVGLWIPLAERSRFMSSFQGFSFGIGITYPLCGFVINNFGWPYVFYMTGSLGVAWCIGWYFLAYNTPQQHPRITQAERDYIELSVGSDARKSLSEKVPWKRIFLSMPAIAIGVTTFGRIWVHYIFIVCGPTFMKHVLKFEYQTNGFLSGMPFICSYISSVFFCYVADKILYQKLLSLTNVRKLFTALSQVIPGLLIYWVGYMDNIVILLVIWFIAVMFITASYAGAMANIVDLSPNYSGSVLAFCQTIHMSASFLSPLVAGMLVTEEDSIQQWRRVFTCSSIVAVLTYIVYQIFGTAEVQSWNNARPTQTQEESEMLKQANDDVNIIPKPK